MKKVVAGKLHENGAERCGAGYDWTCLHKSYRDGSDPLSQRSTQSASEIGFIRDVSYHIKVVNTWSVKHGTIGTKRQRHTEQAGTANQGFRDRL